MGHAGSTGSITLDVYSKTWWDELTEPEESNEENHMGSSQEPVRERTYSDLWEAFSEPQAIKSDQISMEAIEKNDRL